MSENQLKSDEERNFKIGQDQQDDPVMAIAKRRVEFEAQRAARQREEIAAEIISQEKAAKVKAARDQLVNLLIDGHQDAVKDFADGLTADDRRELVNSLKEDDDSADEAEEKPLTPEVRALVDSVMKK